MNAVELLVLRKLWTAVLSSRGYADVYEFRAENGDSIDDIDRLLRRRYVARDGENYRLTVLGLVAAGDEDMRQVLAAGDELYAHLLANFRNPDTRRKSLSVAALTEKLTLKGERRTVYLRQLSEAIMLWCEQYTTDFDDPNAIIRAGEGVYRFKGIVGVLAEMEKWHQTALAEEERIVAAPLPLVTDANEKPSSPSDKDLGVPERVTIPWLLRNVPVALWLGSGAVIVSVFVAGIRVGQIPLIEQLMGSHDTPPATVTSETACRGLSSTSGTQKAKVTFTNFSDVRTVSVYWINYDGAAQFQFKIGPRGSQTTDTFVSHSFCARDAETGHDIFAAVIRSAAQDVVIPP